MQNLLYRRTFDAATLLRQHPPRISHPHKAELFKMAYPQGQPSPASIDITRWAQYVQQPVTLPPLLSAEVRPDFYDYQPVAGPSACLEWHVNFADPRLFVAYGSGLFAQDEMQIAEHPLLACVREALLSNGLSAETGDEKGATPILVRNVERRIAVSTNVDASAGRPAGLYGNRFAAASIDAVRRATRLVEPPTFSNIIAMAAPAGGYGEYTESEIEFIFATAYTGFAAAVHETASAEQPARRTIVHSGFWGCGAFGGNRRLMIALQALAARATNISQLVLHAGDTSGLADAQRGLDIADVLAQRCGASCTLDTIVGRAAILGYQWGESDGN